MEKIIFEVPGEYRETIDFLKQVLAWKDGWPIQNDNDLAEVLISGFMSLIEQEMVNNTPACDHHHNDGEKCHHH